MYQCRVYLRWHVPIFIRAAIVEPDLQSLSSGIVADGSERGRFKVRPCHRATSVTKVCVVRLRLGSASAAEIVFQSRSAVVKGMCGAIAAWTR